MKKLILSVVATLMISAVSVRAQAITATNSPTLIPAVENLVSAFTGGATNWYFGAWGLYDDKLPHKEGGGVGAFYKLSRYIVSGLRLEYIDAELWMPDGEVTLQLPITPISKYKWLTVTPFAFGGVGFPLTNKGVDNNGNVTAITGAGGAIGIYNKAGSRWGLDGVADIEKWVGFPGNQIRIGLVVKYVF